MTKDVEQVCPKCRHMNPGDALACYLCETILARTGMTLTCFPGSALLVSNSDDETIAPQRPPLPENENNCPASGVAHFKIIEVLGRGGMGAVYKAEDLTLGRYVALKLFSAQSMDTVGQGQQLLDEARMACKLNHPNIVTIHDIARDADCNHIVMEWVDGLSLDKLIPEQGMPVITAMEYACQIIDGLACAHENGIIHRDIKPHNIMRNKEGRIKILDFGIANLLSQPSGTISLIQNGILGLVGTPSYMAPEQIMGEALDQRADIFSFGIVLYEMLTGLKPFVGKDVDALKEALNSSDYIAINVVKPQLPAEVIALIDKMLAGDIDKRWQTSAELSTEMHRVYKALTHKKTWWQQRHWFSKAVMILPLMFMLGWSLKELLFPPTTSELVERQLSEATKIAFLPFENISGDPLLQLFNDGLITSLSNDLAMAGREQGDGSTWVIPASEIRRMAEPSVKNISDEFGVDLVITGSMQHMGSTRSLVINIINAKDGRQLKNIDLSIDAVNLFQGQQAVREQVFNLLDWNISKTLIEKFNAQRPQFDGAYKEYIEGVGYLYRYDQQGNTEKALNSFNRAIEMDANYQQAYVGLAEAQLTQFIETKEMYWLELVRQTIEDLEKINSQNSKLNYLLAQMSFKQGEYQKAVEQFSKSIKVNPAHIESFFGLGNSYEKLHQFEKAEDVYREAMKISPNNSLGITYLGIIYLNRGDYTKAIEQFEQQIKITPNNQWAYLNAAVGYYSLGQIDGAIKYTEKAIELSPAADSFANLGTLYFYMRDYENAVKSYEKMIDLNSTDYINWGNLADAYHYSNNDKSVAAYQRAAELAQQAIELNSKDTRAMADAAYYLASLNKRQEAMDYAMKISDQQNGQENFIAATAYALLKESDLAFKHLSYAIEKSYPLDEIQRSPLLDNIKNDSRFGLLVKLE